MLAVESESIRHGQIRPRPSPSRTSHQHRVCFDDVDIKVDMALVDEAQVQTCFGSSQDIIGATETGYLLTFSSTRRWNGVRSETRPRALPPTADEVRVLPTGSQPRSPMRGSNRARGSLECGRGGASPCQDGCA